MTAVTVLLYGALAAAAGTTSIVIESTSISEVLNLINFNPALKTLLCLRLE